MFDFGKRLIELSLVRKLQCLTLLSLLYLTLLKNLSLCDTFDKKFIPRFSSSEDIELFPAETIYLGPGA